MNRNYTTRHRGKHQLPSSGAAFTLIEVLVVLGIVAILVSLLVAGLASARSQSLAAINLSNMRGYGTGLTLYTGDHNDLPPLFTATRAHSPVPWDIGFGPVGGGDWWEQSMMASLLISPYLDDLRVLWAGGRTTPLRIYETDRGPMGVSDFDLSDTLYAEPAFFSWETRRGQSQFGGQRLGSVQFPSQKGVIKQLFVFHHPGAEGFVACCTVDYDSAVYFGDGSVSPHILRRLRPGIFNNEHKVNYWPPSQEPTWLNGAPVEDTVNGVRGIDL